MREMRMKNKASILLVDDDIGMTETLFDIFTDLGYYVEIANDGLKALEKVKTRTFDVILMDIKMPGINGVEPDKKIKHIRPEAVGMMMTAYSVEDFWAEALKEGAYEIMRKTIEIPKVVQFVEGLEKSALILIVDDDLSTCKTLTDVLFEKGYRIATASNGKEAINMLKEKNFDIVFIDVKMPVMNGLEVYRALREIRPYIKVIMMTGYRQEVQDLIEEATKNSAYTCIYKPFDAEEVLKLVEEILAKKPKAEIYQQEVN